MPGTDLMPSGAMETFTGSNGSAPNPTNITQSLNQGSGGGISIQSNQCRIRTGGSQFNRTSFRITGLSVADAEVEFDWVVTSLSVVFQQFFMRANSLIDTQNGYRFGLEPNDMTVSRVVSGSGPSLVTSTHGFTVGQAVRTRVAIFGQRIRARTWLQSNPEPTGSWQIDYTDPTGSGGISAAGSIGWTASSATSGSKDVFFDDIDIHNAITPTQAVLNATGSITASGVLKRRPAKNLAGSITTSGVLTKSRAVTRTFTASITPSGAFAKALPRRFTGSITATGVLKKLPSRRFTGSVTSSGILKKRPARLFGGSITPTGSTAAIFVGRVFGKPGLVVMNVLHRAEVRIRHRRG